MKVLKKIFYAIAILIMAGCVFVLVCALNPSLTQTLASAVAEESEASSEESGQVEVSGENVSGEQSSQESLVADEQTGSANTADSNITDPVQVGYIAPSEDAITQPEQVSGKAGYEPVEGKEEQILDAEAENLQNSLSMGEVGADLSFDTEIYPYYGLLDNELQQLYRQIYANALGLRTSFSPVITVGTERVKDVFEAVYNDHPELFWLETGYSCKYNQKGICLEITLKYNETADDLATSKKLFEEQAQTIIYEASKKSSDYEKELFVHDALVKRVDYNTGADMNQSAYSAIVNGKSVCAGYARAFQYLMQQLGIPCYYCTGYSGGDHAWNIVKLDGKYVNVDVTWDDTNPSTYDYFNKTDLDYAKTHVRKGLSTYLPACNGSAAGNAAMGVEGSDLSAYVNSDPQEPLEYPSGTIVTDADRAEQQKQENLKKAGITEDDVLDNMTEYYADCLKQMVEVGEGQKYFTNVVPQSLWSSIEQAYGSDSYEKGYVTEGLKKLDKEHFAIQLQVDDISGGYYRIYHNIVTW